MRRSSAHRLSWFCKLVLASAALIAGGGVAAGSEAAGPRISYLEHEDGTLDLEIRVPPVRWTRVGSGWLPRMAGFGRLSAVGSPDVPARRERIAVEPGGGLRLLDVDVEWAEGVIPGEVLPYPAEQAALTGRRLDDRDYRGLWPRQPAQLVELDGALRSLQFVTIELRPLQLDLAAGRFRVATRLVVRAKRTAGKLPSVPASALDTDAFSLSPGETAVVHGAGTVGRIQLGSGGLSSLETSAGVDGPGTFPAFQLNVDRRGLHRVTYAWAQANAPGLLSFLTAHDPRQLRLSVQGLEIPMLVEGEADGVFDSAATNPPEGDALVFYGEPLTGDPFADDGWQDGDFSDVNVYRLDTAPAPARIPPAAGTRSPTSGYTVAASFRETVRLEEDAKFQGFVPSVGDDHWFVDPFVVSPVCVDTAVETCDVTVNSSFCSSCDGPGEVCCADQVDQVVATPGHVGGSIDLRVRMMGITGTTFHRSEILVDGASADVADWDGFVNFVQGVEQGPITLTPASPLGATTTVTLRAPLGRTDGGGGDVTRDWLAYDWVEIDYDRSYAAQGSTLEFTSPDANRELRVAGFASIPEVWEISETAVSLAGLPVTLPRRVQGVALVGNEARYEIDANGAGFDPRRFVAADATGYATPVSVREDLPPSAFDAVLGDTLQSGSLGADWVVIGPASLLDLAPGSRLDDLRGHRESQGLATLVVDIQDIYDDFTEGLVDPQAIKDFIGYTLQNWATPPRFFVLVGDGTWDHKNNHGYPASRQFVPTYMFDLPDNSQFGYHPSDTWKAAVIGSDNLPDAAIGRIPAHSLAESEEVFRKIVAYETGPNPASWAGRALLVAEHDTDVGNEFFRAQDEVFDAWFASGPQTATKVYEQDPLSVGCNIAADNQNAAIDANVNAGAALMSFAGHGGFKNWGKSCSFFTTDNPGVDDLADLGLDTPLPFTVQANCITGNFAATTSQASSSDTQYSFVEDWLLTERKGIIGGLAPSHLSFTFELDLILDGFYSEIFGPRKERLVANIDAAMRAEFDSLNNAVLVRSFILQADPALRLAVPAPGAPEILSVTAGGSGELSLTWTSAPDAATYRVYRAVNPNGPYVVAGNTAATSFVDSGLTNCSTYYYYVVSVDADDFESRWSNFNSDCTGAAQDCRSGTPQNPVAPATPPLLSVTDTQSGGELLVEWDASSPEPDLLRYRVLWGTVPGVYTGSKLVPVGFGSTLVSQLDNNVEYFVAVQAENCTQASAPSAELSGIPHLVRGVNPPRSIQDLMVFNEPDVGDGVPDNRLSWTVPAETVWGVVTTVQSIEVHGSTAGPAFQVNGGSLLASLPATADEWIHEDQASEAAPDWYYLVVAVDTAGGRSAYGAELPAAIEDLTLVEAGGGTQIELSWSAVVESASDGPLNPPVRVFVSHYNVYGRPSVLPRAEAGPANELQSGVVGTTVTVPMPAGAPGDVFTYQVLAEDSHGSESVW